MSNGGGSDQGGGEGGEKCLASGCILKVEQQYFLLKLV